MMNIVTGWPWKKIGFLSSVAGALACFFVLYSFLAFQELSASPVRLNSPDETANYYFSKAFAERSEIGYSEPLLKESKNFIHPRSMTTSADGERAVPVSFLGMVLLYGALGKVFGSGAILFFTPAFAALGSVFFYFLLTHFFSKRLALLSSVLLLIHPAYWYYASKSMFPNVLFIDVLIIGGFLLWKAFRARASDSQRAYAWFFFSGMFVGLALIVRLSELPWVFFLFLCIWLWHIRRFRIMGTVVFLIGIVPMLAVLFYANQQIYGNALSSGYAQIDTSQSAAGMQSALSVFGQGRVFDGAWWDELMRSTKDILAPFLKYLFPFGFTPHIFKKNFLTYFISLFWWFALPAAIGALCLVFEGFRKIRKQIVPGEWGYLCVFFLVGAWLIPFYGSWVISDTITGEATIGNSYVRYWLVLYCFMIPLTARGLLYLYDHAHFFLLKGVAMPLIVFAFFWYSFQGVLWEKTDGLIEVAGHIREYRETASRVLTLTESDAVIFSSRSDKIFFPQRRAAQSFEGFPEAELIPPVLNRVPVYYFGSWDQSAAEYISKKYFLPHNMAWKYIEAVREREYLYRVTQE